MIDEHTKKLIRDYGIMIAIFLIFCGILIPSIIFSRKSWNNGLAIQVQNVLDKQLPDTYKVGDKIEIHSLLSTSAAVYSLKQTKGSSEQMYGIIIRIPTLYGPQPGVFVYSKEGGAHFAGYAFEEGKVTNALSAVETDTKIQYWCHRIPDIVNKTGEQK